MQVTLQHPTHGVLDFPRALQAFRLARHAPAADLAPWIEGYWEVEWNLAGEVHRQTNLSHAAVNVALEDLPWLYGVPGPTFVRELSGSGRVFGVKFHPGAFAPWYGRALRSLFDKRIPLADLWGSAAELWARQVRAEADFEVRASLADAFLRPRKPAPPGEGWRCASRLVEDRSLLRVEDACRQLGHTPRSLERLFDREVGATPKDVLRRYRLMEAAESLARKPHLGGADLAASLGYADQAHFIRDFKEVTGVPPEAYRRRQAPP